MSMRIRAASRVRRLAAASVGVAALVLVPTIASVGQTEAAWVNGEHATTTATAGTLSPLARVAGCQGVALSFDRVIRWTNPGTGVARTGVALSLWTTGATPVMVGSEALVPGATSTQVTLEGDAPTGVPAGTYQLRVSTYVGTNWRSTTIAGTLTYTTAALGGTYISACSW